MTSRSYVISSSPTEYLKVSDDGGLTWQTITSSGYPSPSSVVSITADPFNAYKVLISTSGLGLWLSTDGGNSFNQISGTSGFSFNHSYFIDSLNIIAVGDQIFKSVNGGISFFSTGNSSGSLYGSVGSGIVCNCTYFGAYSIGFVGIYDKLYKSLNGGLTWFPVNGDLPIVANKVIYSLRHLNDENVVLAVVQDNGIFLSNDGGATFSLVLASVPSISEYALFGNRLNTQSWYIASDQKIYYSPDSQLTWNLVGTYPNSPASNNQGVFAFSPLKAIVSAIGSNSAATGIYTTSDGGTTLNLEEDYPGRQNGITSTYEYDCGECPNKGEFNEQTGLCDVITYSGPLCPDGYTYDPETDSCIGPSTYYPKDIIISRDNSGSITGGLTTGPFCDLAPSTQTEWNQMTLMQDDIITGISAEITSSDIQVGVVDWSSLSTLTQPLTSVLVDVQSAVCAQRTYSSGTNTVLGLCTAYNELKFGATQNPSAEKIIMLFTDGVGGVGTCVVNGVLYNVSSGNFAELRQLATAIKNDGVKIILIALGTASEIANVYDAYINVPDPIPSLDSNGNLLYFNATFDTASDIVTAIIDGLSTNESIPLGSCPEGCTRYVNTIDDTVYCECVEQYAIVPCCYQLSDCLGVADNIITQTDLSDYFSQNQIIKIQGSDVCWTISQLDTICPNAEAVIVTDVFSDCVTCNPSFGFYNCKDPNVVIYTTQDFSGLLGKTVKISGYPNDCWQVGLDLLKTGPYFLVITSEQYDTCEQCNPKQYQLTNCLNDEAIIITDNDLSNYLNQVITVKGIPGICFSVTEILCDCIKVTVNGLDYQVNALGQINNRNYYQVNLGLSTITIAWDDDEQRWEVVDSATEVLYLYSGLNIDCPFTDYWEFTDDTPFYISSFSISYCYTELTDIIVDETFKNCECCTNC